MVIITKSPFKTPHLRVLLLITWKPRGLILKKGKIRVWDLAENQMADPSEKWTKGWMLNKRNFKN